MRIAFTYDLQTEPSEQQAEFDTPQTVHRVASGLRNLGHDVGCVNTAVAFHHAIEKLVELEPELVFNMSEGRTGRGREALFPAVFEHLGIPFTGSDSRVCTVTLDKQLTKSIVERYGVRTPACVLIQSVEGLAARRFTYPLIVKPNYEGSSKGIDSTSIVDGDLELRRRVEELLEAYPDGVLVEQFINGRDVVVPFLEAANPGCGGILEPVSYEYPSDSEHGIFDLERKLRGFEDVKVSIPASIPPEQRARLMMISRRVVTVLGVRDLGRLDFRLDPDGRPYFLEINALPSLERDASIFGAAALVGFPTVESVLGAIVRSALIRRGMPAPDPCRANAHAPAISG